MTDLITEARELCERATPGPWEVKLHNEDYGQGYGETTFFVDMDGMLLKIGIADAAEKYAKYNALSAFIARSRTLIPELCDALEDATKAVPVVRGEWIESPTKDSVLCSYCHADWNLFDNDTYRFCYCPNCGAKMESEIEEG